MSKRKSGTDEAALRVKTDEEEAAFKRKVAAAEKQILEQSKRIEFYLTE